MTHAHAEHLDQPTNRGALTRFAWLSIAAAITTIALKSGAYLLTDSIGLLSDAIESVINLVAAVMALTMLTIAARPPDESHVYGHAKAEYFSSTVEGILIIVAAGGITYSAVARLLNPRPLGQLEMGLVISGVASVINFIVSRILLKAGQTSRSITLEADAQHLMTDVWTSVGVLGGIAVVAITKLEILDPLVAIAVAFNITWTGFKLLRRSVAGLMDASLSAEDQKTIEAVLAGYQEKGIGFHALRTRQGASRRFISLHVLVPGSTTVHDAHHIAEDIERDIRDAISDAVVFTHLEPVDDEISLHDIPLDR